MSQAAKEKMQKFAAEVLARLAELATPAAHAAANELNASLADAEVAQVHAARLDRILEAHDYLNATIQFLENEGREALEGCAPFDCDPDDPEPAPPEVEKKSRFIALHSALGYFDGARGALIEAFTGNIERRAERLREARNRARSRADAALSKLDDALGAAAKLAGMRASPA